MNDSAEKFFILTLRDLEQQRDLSLIRLEALLNKPADAYEDRIFEIKQLASEAMEAEQLMEFLKDKFTQPEP